MRKVIFFLFAGMLVGFIYLAGCQRTVLPSLPVSVATPTWTIPVTLITTPTWTIPVTITTTPTKTATNTPTSTIPVTMTQTASFTPTPTTSYPGGGVTLTKSESGSSFAEGQTILYVLSYTVDTSLSGPITGLVLTDPYSNLLSPALGESTSNAGAAVSFEDPLLGVELWKFPSPITSSFSGSITWWSLTGCPPSGYITNTADFSWNGRGVTQFVYSNPVTAQVLCATNTPTSTIPVTETASPTWTIPVTFTYTPMDTATDTPTSTIPVTLTTTPTWTIPVTFTYTPMNTATDTPTSTIPVTFTDTPTDTPTPTITVVCSNSGILGDSTTSFIDPVTMMGGTVGQQYILPQSASVTALYVNLYSPADISLGIYSDYNGTYPLNLIYASAPQSMPAGFNSVVVNPAVNLPAGTYWLAVASNTVPTLLVWASGSTANVTWEGSGAYMPNPYLNLTGTPMPTPPPIATNNQGMIYAGYCY